MCLDEREEDVGSAMISNRAGALGRLVWEESLSVGIRAADRDHQQIVGLINRVIDAMESVETGAEMLRLFDDFIDFAKQHFQREEDLMSQHDYPEFLSHREVHRFLEKKMFDYKRAFVAGEEDRQSTSALMKDWLILHIRGVDKRYSRFLHARGVE